MSTNLFPIRFGVLGAAKIVPNALTTPAREVDGVEVVAVAARDPQRAREFATVNQIPRVVRSYDELISDPEIDVIYNPLPNSLHCEWSIRAMRAGKHVLCEKPIASNAIEAEQMARVAKETGRILVEAFHYHYHPLAERVRSIIQGGQLGKLSYVEGVFTVPIPPDNIRYDLSLAGGATMDLGCYPLHMITHFTGLRAKVLRAKAVNGPERIDVTMETDLELAGGVAARMKCSMATDSTISATFSARGERGELNVVNPVGPHWGNQLTIKIGGEEKRESIKGDATYTYQLRAFAALIRGEGTFPTDADDAIANMTLIDDVYRASGLGIRAA
ncbi:MAG TPA: Gfo/Idh/MocA family oxidoreductase [Candidatus Binataceae bacterium]|nr:Gfo/Idh/MocA family oxidoreductase [Candidatus Binataceae bacterium]